MLRSELRALQYCGKFGLAPVSLPDRLRAEPANFFRSDRPLTWDETEIFRPAEGRVVRFCGRVARGRRRNIEFGRLNAPVEVRPVWYISGSRGPARPGHCGEAAALGGFPFSTEVAPKAARCFICSPAPGRQRPLLGLIDGAG